MSLLVTLMFIIVPKINFSHEHDALVEHHEEIRKFSITKSAVFTMMRRNGSEDQRKTRVTAVALTSAKDNNNSLQKDNDLESTVKGGRAGPNSK